ncbi:hypothetical protein RM543_07210 [Roseicyclus sp. F158]|uniref:Oligosaccharide repeat unit polymerase n=1 Tax=Tropicimonas omnivorans TaxID=3075590 RepID=A0ABU3DFH5_9RHOB|nr:hypothetical protein [Roseicyclus sp. F158]MDT0682466.1 hypothetical protein [Roseicyclus sp. F158]
MTGGTLPAAHPRLAAAIWLTGASHLCLAAGHLALGSDRFLTASMGAMSLWGISRLMRDEIWPGDYYVFALGIYSGTAALAVKLAYAQPLQSNLQQPGMACAILLGGFVAAAGAAEIARFVARHVVRPATVRAWADPGLLARAYPWLLAAGAAFLLLHVAVRPRMVAGVLHQTDGFGGFGGFTFLLTLGIAAASRRLLIDGARGPFRVLILAGIAMVTLSLVANTKREVFEFGVCLLLGLLAARARLRILPSLVAIGAAAVIALYVSPVIHLMRNDFLEIGLMDRVLEGWTILKAHGFDPAALAEEEARFFAGFSYAYREAGSYVFPERGAFDRFMLILPVDQVARMALEGEVMGVRPFAREALEGILPSILIDKSVMVGSDRVAWAYGIREYGSSARPVLGFTATALAMGGPVAVIAAPILVLLPILIAFNIAFGHLRASALGHGFIAITWYLAEQGVDSLISFAGRNAVLMWVVSALLATWWRERGA